MLARQICTVQPHKSKMYSIATWNVKYSTYTFNNMYVHTVYTNAFSEIKDYWRHFCTIHVCYMSWRENILV